MRSRYVASVRPAFIHPRACTCDALPSSLAPHSAYFRADAGNRLARIVSISRNDIITDPAVRTFRCRRPIVFGRHLHTSAPCWQSLDDSFPCVCRVEIKQEHRNRRLSAHVAGNRESRNEMILAQALFREPATKPPTVALASRADFNTPAKSASREYERNAIAVTPREPAEQLHDHCPQRFGTIPELHFPNEDLTLRDPQMNIELADSLERFATRRTFEYPIQIAQKHIRQSLFRELLKRLRCSFKLTATVTAAAWTTTALKAFVFGVSVHDAPSFVLAPIVLPVVAVGATALPAWRAARTDPLIAIRSE